MLRIFLALGGGMRFGQGSGLWLGNRFWHWNCGRFGMGRSRFGRLGGQAVAGVVFAVLLRHECYIRGLPNARLSAAIRARRRQNSK